MTVTLTNMEAEKKRSPFWPLYLIGALVVVGVMGVVAWNIELPYLAFSAGPVSDAADSVVAEDVDIYPPDGELLMLTVVSQDVNVFEALIAGIDPTIDLVPKRPFVVPGSLMRITETGSSNRWMTPTSARYRWLSIISDWR